MMVVVVAVAVVVIVVSRPRSFYIIVFALIEIIRLTNSHYICLSSLNPIIFRSLILIMSLVWLGAIFIILVSPAVLAIIEVVSARVSPGRP